MGKIIGLDLGSVTLGIAISDPLGIIAQGVETFRFPQDQDSLAIPRVKELCEKENVKTIVLGLPKHMNGDVGIRGEICLKFKEKLEKRIEGVEVVLQDERLSTKIAEQSLIFADVSRKKRKQFIDKMAAVTILQTYLDSH